MTSSDAAREDQPEPVPDVSDKLLATALSGLAPERKWFAGPAGRHHGAAPALRSAVQTLISATEPDLGFLDSTVAWTAVVGGTGAIALRAASAATPQDERSALIALLEAVADTPLAEPDGRWREITFDHAGPLSDIRLGTVLSTSAGRAVILDATSWRQDQPQLRLLEYASHGDFGTVPGGVVVSSRPAIGWGGDGHLAEFLNLLHHRGAAPWRPDAVQALSEATGMSRALAAMLLAGVPKAGFTDPRILSKHTREILGLKVVDVEGVQRTLAELDLDRRLLLCDTAMPSNPADLWDRGPDVKALAAAWIRLFGRRIALSEAVLANLGAVLTDGNAGRFARRTADLLQGLADPENCPWLSLDQHWSIRDGILQGEGEPQGFTPDVLLATTTALLWLAYHLAPDDPLRSRLPLVFAQLRRRLGNPDLILRLQDGFPLAPVRAAYGHPKAARKKAAPPSTQNLSLGPAGYLVIKPDWPDQMFVRPALLDAEDPLLTVGNGETDAISGALRRMADPGFARLIASLEAPGWAQDPLVSAPELVPLAADRLAVDLPAARLYLQLLALPDPTDKNVMRWNGWTRRELRQATATLKAVAAVVEDKRPKAGRTAFLPGDWLELPMPLEAWKAALFERFPNRTELLGMTVPAVPVGELFRLAWLTAHP